MPEATLSFFARDVVEVARDLVGATLLFHGVGGVIVEVEAYHPTDPASHSFAGRTARNAAMFGPVGRAYVYRIYGLHWSMNAVAGTGPGSGILIRALEPTHGLAEMRARREVEDIRALCSGPGKLCQALGVTRAEDGRALTQAPFAFHPSPMPREVVAGPRIGVTKGAETPWRFGLKGSPFLSRPFPR